MLLLAALYASQAALPPQTIDRDNIEIRTSCTVRIAGDAIADADNNGVITIAGDGIIVDFAGATLRGAAPGRTPDQFAGTGIRITGKNVTLRNASIAGFKCGIHALSADGLTLENCDVSGNFAQRLRSTPKAEDGGDWLWPHRNDEREWMKNYGAGMYIERSTNVTIRNCRARTTQNGLLLDRVTHSKVYDNDFSFLSGWGLGMWRCEDNIISRNALDFCVRGYSHGVYNRGQDSAGILFFEQNNRNVIIENSATHGGDGLFAFAGREALGEVWLEEQRNRLRKELGEAGIQAARQKLASEKGKEWEKRSDDDVINESITITPAVLDQFKRRGNAGNIFAGNDFSYAPAHGLELTFSFGNWILDNRMVDNAICGIWGGYSQDTVIRGNTFEGNGAMGYGAERGGVNIEHGRGNIIHGNTFKNNACGVHLWWDADEGLLRLPWAKANGGESADNAIVSNTFDGDQLGIQLRITKSTTISGNRMSGVNKEIDADKQSDVKDAVVDSQAVKSPSPAYQAIGDTRPVGARQALRGRDRIIMTEWGPYDWQRPYLQFVGAKGDAHEFRLIGAADAIRSADQIKQVGDVDVTLKPAEAAGSVPMQSILVKAKRPGGVSAYRLSAATAAGELSHRSVIMDTRWKLRCFAWTADPRKDEPAWRKEAEKGVEVEIGALDLKFGGGGPSQLKDVPKELVDAKLPTDRFGTIASTRLDMPAGKWRLTVTSDDGVRVLLDGKVLLEDWTWHAPKTESREFMLDSAKTVELRVEHFELDGFSVLSVEIEPAE